MTAQKRTENLQKVPISMQVLGEEKLDELNVTDFEDYVKFLPSVSYQTFGPGFAQIYMRGVASGGDGNHSGSLPSVGVYLDEQPVTTIQGPLDMHIYDIARVEALSGPQGTLYGASSQAGALRIITNKPDPSGIRRRLRPGGQQRRPWRHRPRRGRLRQHPARRTRRHPPGRLGQARRRLHRQQAGRPAVPDARR